MSTADADRRDVNERLAKLGPAQRAILERRLLEQRATAAAAARIPRRAVLTPVPLAYSQELLWLLSQLESGVAYNAPAAFRLQGPIDAAALQRALDSLVRDHRRTADADRGVDRECRAATRRPVDPARD
jgi:hypothetical protein